MNYLHHSAPIAEALSNPRLDSAAKVVESFENPKVESENVGEDDTLFRDGDPEVHERVLARDRYEKRVKRGWYQTQESLQDSMLGLREAMDAILMAGGKNTDIEDVNGFENAYLGENRLSSVNKAEADAFAHLVFKPMLDEVAKLAKTKAEREGLTDYMMAKHGLERNIVMAERDFNKYLSDNPNGTKTLDDFRERDYAGLTALTGMDNVADAEAEAQRMVSEYESGHDTANLWKKVKVVNSATLSKLYECGFMNKETYNAVSNMYEYYIPLRGFDEKTSNEAYAYLTDKHSAFNAPIKKAHGRSSKADDPFANMQSMAESAIMQGNRNKLVKQRFLNFVLNHPSDLASISDLWIQYDNVADEWKPVFPDNIEVTDTPDEVEKKMNDFNERMEQLAANEPDKYKHGRDAVGIPYRVVGSSDLRQHQIVVKRNGRDYIITINGNPRAAQAINGLTNPDNDVSGSIGAVLRAGEKINRQLSAFYTTRNPDFIISNFMRDMLYTNSMVWIKESPNYALRFHRNIVLANPAKLKSLLAKHREGTLDMSDPIEKMFHQFMMNGGETGYANIRDIEQHKNDIRRELKKANSKIPIERAWDLLGERFDEYNRAVENCARFAAFVTSRQFGRSIDRAIYDAKEISVNFNKKGSGSKFYKTVGQTKAGNVSSFISGIGRSGFVFWNAAIQGTTNFGRQAKRHPAKALTAMATMFILGALMAHLNGDDDDDDKNAYYNLPDHVRRSNLLFRAGEHWISLPLPQEYRAIYGMGELMSSVLNGKEHYTDGELAEKILGQMTQVLPLDIMEGGGGFGALIDQQRYVNRLITLYDWIMRASAKGVLLMPEDCLPDGVSMEDIAESWTEFNGIIIYKPSLSGKIPQQVANNSTNIGIAELLNIQLKFFDDISGITQALQGKPGYSGESAAHYSQQTDNATKSLLDLLECFSGFVIDGAYKDVKNMQQFYDSKRVFNIAGKSGAQIIYDPKKIRDVEFDLSITESTATPAYRHLANDILMQLWQAQAISVEQLLEHGDFPFADELLQSIKSQREQLEQGKVPDGISPQLMQQAQQGANMQAVNRLRNAMRQTA